MTLVTWKLKNNCIGGSSVKSVDGRGVKCDGDNMWSANVEVVITDSVINDIDIVMGMNVIRHLVGDYYQGAGEGSLENLRIKDCRL